MSTCSTRNDLIWQTSLHSTVYEPDLMNKPHLPHLAPGFTGRRSGKKVDVVRGSANLLGGRFRDQNAVWLFVVDLNFKFAVVVILDANCHRVAILSLETCRPQSDR